MALFLLQSPGVNPISANTYTLYSVSSSIASQHQSYRYVFDLYDDASNKLTTVTTYPNVYYSSTTINLANIFTDYITPTLDFLNTSDSFPSTAKRYTLKIGDQYGDPVVKYPDQITDLVTATLGEQIKNGILTNQPLHTYYYSGSLNFTVNKQVADVTYKNAAGGTITTTTHNPGPDLLKRFSIDPTIGWTTVEIQDDSTTYVIERKDACRGEAINFVFLNQYGMWESYSTDLPIKESKQIQSTTIKRPLQRYEDQNYFSQDITVSKTKKEVDTTTTYQLTTDYLTAEQSKWLEELVISKDVYLQTKEGMFGIIIDSTTVTTSTNTFRNKTFQTTINFSKRSQIWQ